MKVLALAVILMSFPFAIQAKSWDHSRHNHDHRDYQKSSFWEQVEQRQYRQHSRIDRGVEEGRLTKREAKKLRREEKHVRKQIKHYKRHHYQVNYEGRRDIMDHLDFLSKRIRELKHNDHYSRRARHNHQKYTHYDKRYERRDSRQAAWQNNNYSRGFYLRF